MQKKFKLCIIYTFPKKQIKFENQLDLIKIHMKHLTCTFLKRFTEKDKLNPTDLAQIEEGKVSSYTEIRAE